MEFVEEASSPSERAVAQAHREISLLREYRTRLIADVVTGKLDVREAADEVLRLPDGGCLMNCVRTIQNRWQSAGNLSVYGELWPSLLLDGCLIGREAA